MFSKLKPRLEPLPKGCFPNQPHMIIATWFGSGRIRPAPGTMGSLAAIPLGIALQALYGIPALLLGIAVAFAIGVISSNVFEEKSGEHDNSSIVIDEVVGMWIAAIPAGTTIWLWGVAFVLFRIFDAIKPWPISKLDREVEGGLGVMIDDVAAGFVAMCGTSMFAIPFLTTGL